MPIADLKHKAVSGTIWSGVESVTRQGVQIGVTILLARLLTPEDFGTVALLSIFIGLARTFVDSGLSAALIQRPNIREVELSSVFYFNCIVSVVAAAILCFAAPGIARFYRAPVLTPLTSLLAINVVIGSLGAVQGALLNRALRFDRQCVITLAATLGSAPVAILLALHGAGVWSLACQTLTATSINTAMLWRSTTWRPTREFSIRSLGTLYRFGSFLFLATLLETLFSRLYTLIIGKFYSARDLGYYSRADSTCMIPGNLLSTILGRVAFPVFSSAQADKTLLRQGLRKAIRLAMFCNIPIMVGIAASAEPLILSLLGDKWTPCIPLTRILAIAGVFWPLHVLNLNVLTAQGCSNLFFSLELQKKSAGIAIIGTACIFGVTAIAWAAVVVSLVSFALNARYSGRLLDYDAKDQLLDLLPYVAGSAVVLVVIRAAAGLPLTNPWACLSSQVAVGTVAYVLICHMFRFQAYVDTRELISANIRTWRSLGHPRVPPAIEADAQPPRLAKT